MSASTLSIQGEGWGLSAMSQPINRAYVLQADLYNKLSDAKVIGEAALRSGIPKGAINAAWDAIGEVIKAWNS